MNEKDHQELVRAVRLATIEASEVPKMHTLSNPVRSLPSVLLYYLATAFCHDGQHIEPIMPARISGGGLPADTVMLDAQSAILSFTCVSAPMFRAKIERVAAAEAIDVVLMRCCLTTGDLLPIAADVVLAGGGLAPFSLNDMALYRHDDGGLWLVPHGFGGAIRFELHGLELYLVPPYQTLADRAGGIYRTASELAALLFPQEAC